MVSATDHAADQVHVMRRTRSFRASQLINLKGLSHEIDFDNIAKN
jgi:hypothetical protein